MVITENGFDFGYYYDQMKPVITNQPTDFNLSDRQLYYYLLNNEDYTIFLPQIWHKIVSKLSVDKNSEIELFFNNQNSKNLISMNSLMTLKKEMINKGKEFDIKNYSPEAQKYIVKQHAPFYRIDGAWLSGCISIKNAGYKFGGALLKCHSELVGNGHIDDNHSVLFERYATTYNINLSPLYSESFVLDSEIDDFAFDIPVFLLAISHFPTLYLPEILGINLFFNLMNEPTLLAKDISNSLFLNKKSLSTKKLVNDSIQAIESYLEDFCKSDQEDTRLRIQHGFTISSQMYEAFYSSLIRSALDDRRFALKAKVLAIFEKIGSKAYGYHKRGKIGGKPLDEWFDPGSFDAKKLLKALEDSHYITPGKPDKSRFITHITAPNGPMFRIFSDEDLAVIHQYINELNNADTTEFNNEKDNPIKLRESSSPFIEEHTIIIAESKKKYQSCTLRELYYYLVNIDLYPDVYPVAREIASQWLSKHSIRLTSGNCPLPFITYDHRKLDQWLERQHEKQVSSYIPLAGKPEKEKTQVIQEAVHLAPLTYIDGAWVRRMLSPSIIGTEVGSRLYNIYVDELGNGSPDLHHGNIYADLMKEMNIQLPRLDSPEFPKSCYFEEDDFQVPVYWLSVSLFPKTFLAELLGLNLAMELSGIGGEYRRAGDILKYYKFNPQFTMLHNTIDNIVSGHTAWSIQAIKLHLDDMFQKGGRETVQQHWRRIWIGYRSLVSPKKRFLYKFSSLSRVFKKQEIHRAANL
jgi:hypothetical protein